MHRYFIYLFLLFNLSNCYITGHDHAVGKLRNTMSKSNPFAYENGFSEVVIVSPNDVNHNSSVVTKSSNQLQFKDTYFEGALSNYMYITFGKWDTISLIKNIIKPMLVWKNVQLFKDINKTYNVGSFGVRNDGNRYAAIVVNDHTYNDCLTKYSPDRNRIKNYFTEAIIKTKLSREFHDAYSDIMQDL